MKILVVFFILVALSASLAKDNDKRKPKAKVKHEPVEEGRRNRNHKRPGPFPEPIGERFPGIREKPRIPYVDEEERGRQPRQAHITIQVPAVSHQGVNQGGGPFQLSPSLQFIGGSHPGNQGSGGIQQDTPFQLQGSSQSGNRPGFLGHFPGNQVFNGNHGSVAIPGGVVPTSSVSTGNHGESGTFQPFPEPFVPGVSDTIGEGPPANSAASGPGGLGSSSDSGLTGGLGGIYGGGYGFGLGGLIFGGPTGPVFAGNAALSEGLSGNADVVNGEFDNPDKQNDSPSQIPLFRPVPPRGSFSDDNRQVTKPKVNNQGNRGIIGSRYPKPPDTSGVAAKNPGASNAGEIIGYVAFIFPRRSSGKTNVQTAEHSGDISTQKSSNEAAASKTRSSTNHLPKPVLNRPGSFFIPVPVHIPIDRPYPVPVPKAYPVQVLKPYPVAVPKHVPVPVPVAVPVPEPVPYEVAKPFPVPVAVPVEILKPGNFEVPVYVNYEPSSGVHLFQPSIETRVIRHRSDKVAKPS